MATARKTTKKSLTTGASPALVPSWNLLLPGGTKRGEERIRLLHAIRATGCLLDAAQVCDISYRTAWNWVQELNGSHDRPLVLSVQGGREGGNTSLSEDAIRLLTLHDTVSELLTKAATDGGLDPSDIESFVHFQRRLSMRTSVRNQFLATVTSVKKGAVNAEVILTIKGGDTLVSQITLGSVENLGLREGAEAWALVKASWIALAVGERPRLSTRNIWEGTIAFVKPGAVNSEVALALPGGEIVTAIVTEESVRHLKLKQGMRAWAVFKANSVILAVN